MAWAPDSNGTREMVGVERDVLRAFSKRSVVIEAELEASGAVYESPAARMRADDAASLATRPAKDHSLTPALLVERWRGEARELGIDSAVALETALVGRAGPRPLDPAEVTAALVDPETGLCHRGPLQRGSRLRARGRPVGRALDHSRDHHHGERLLGLRARRAPLGRRSPPPA